jgi:hypothetical protein
VTFLRNFVSDVGRRDSEARSAVEATGAGIKAAGRETIVGAKALEPSKADVVAAVVRAAEDIDR